MGTSQSRDLFTSKASIESVDGVPLREQRVNQLHNRESYVFNARTVTVTLQFEHTLTYSTYTNCVKSIFKGKLELNMFIHIRIFS